MKVGIPKEIYPRERRVAATPETIEKLRKLGLEALVETGAGDAAGFTDSIYADAGARVVPDAATLFAEADLILKVRPPEPREVDALKLGAVLIGFIWPAQNKDLLQRLGNRRATVLAMDAVPRITRAQRMDALSAMANIAGYRAVLEAANAFDRFLPGQITAAGRVKPAQVLVLGAGVAGLAAIAAARGLGAVVKAFDTRAAAREQVESLGAAFIEFDFKEAGEGQGGYAKEMSAAYLAAEQALIASHAKQSDIVISTALIPGKPAPQLLTPDAVKAMRRGSVIVDMAAEQGGNCPLSERDQVVEKFGVTLIGHTDLPSRMARQSSDLYATTVYNLVESLFSKDKTFKIDLEDEVHRGALILKEGALMWPPPARPKPTAGVQAPAAATTKVSASTPATKPKGIGGRVALVLLIGVLAAAGITGPPEFLQHLTVFLLACVVGWHVIWNVKPALHTPLMSVTNAISGIILVGGMVVLGSGSRAGRRYPCGQRHPVGLHQRRRGVSWSRSGCCACSGSRRGMTIELLGTLRGLTYLGAGMLFILSLRGLSTQESARRGNLLGTIGMGLAVLVTAIVLIATSLGGRERGSRTGGSSRKAAGRAIGLLGAALLGGATIGALVASRVAMTSMPELVAMLHSFVGAAAVLVGISTYLQPSADEAHRAAHLIEIYVGVFVGTVTFSGSVIAFAKLRALVGSRPLMLPGRHALNAVLVGASIVLAVLFLRQPGTDGLTYLLVMTGLALLLGMHLVMAIGGGDMPVVVSLLNSYSGWAAAAAGFMLSNDLLIVTGALVGSSGAILSTIMCRAMNRSIWNVIFGGFGAAPAKAAPGAAAVPAGKVNETSVTEVAELLLAARSVIIVPGYGMAVAQAQHAVKEISSLLIEKGIKVDYAIHPVAGRLPGHMNVLLAEANVSYEIVKEMDEINGEFPHTDVVMVIGANDIVNPSALDDQTEPDLRHARAGGLEGRPGRDAQAQHVGRVRRRRQPARVPRQHADAVRRRAPERDEPARRFARLKWSRAPCASFGIHRWWAHPGCFASRPVREPAIPVRHVPYRSKTRARGRPL